MGVTSPKSERFPNWEYIFHWFPTLINSTKVFLQCTVVYDNCTIDINYVFKLYRLHILVIYSWNICCGNQYKCSLVSDCWMESLLKCFITHICKETLNRLAKPTFLLKISALSALHFQFQFTADIICSSRKIQALHEFCTSAPKYGVLSFLRLTLLWYINWGIFYICLERCLHLQLMVSGPTAWSPCSGSLADCIHAQLTDGSCTEETDNKTQHRSPLLALGAALMLKLSPLVPTWAVSQPCPRLLTYCIALDPDPGPHIRLSILTADLSVTVYLAGAHWNFDLPCLLSPGLVFILTCWHDFLVWSPTCPIAVHLSIAIAMWTWHSELLAEPGISLSLR